jgi:hypothetical protein
MGARLKRGVNLIAAPPGKNGRLEIAGRCASVPFIEFLGVLGGSIVLVDSVYLFCATGSG